MKFKNSIVFIILLGFIWVCKPNAKNQVQYWENNAKSLAWAAQKYPNFKALLDAKNKEASALWAEAAKLTKEEDKAAKMKEANDKLEELLGGFNQIKSKSEGLLSSIDKIDDKKLNAAKDKVRDDAIESVQKTLAEVNQKLTSANPANEEEAKSITKDAISSLISAQGVIDRATKSIKK